MFNKKIVHKYSERCGFTEYNESLALEEKTTIFLNNQEIISLLCSPVNLEELAVGFLFAEGFICNKNDYWEIDIRENGKSIYVYAEETREMQKLLLRGTLTSGCGQGTTFFGEEERLPSVEADCCFSINNVLVTARTFQKTSLVENSTRGFHSAGLLINDDLIIRKDVGRHNAVDKVGGYCLLSGVETQSTALFLTGRISSEIIMKGAKMQIPFIISLSGATSLAVELAQETGITLLGYVRGKTAVIYSHPERIIGSGRVSE